MPRSYMVAFWIDDSLACSVVSGARVVFPIETVSVPRPFSKKYWPSVVSNYTNLICIQPCSPVFHTTKLAAKVFLIRSHKGHFD